MGRLIAWVKSQFGMNSEWLGGCLFSSELRLWVLYSSELRLRSEGTCKVAGSEAIALGVNCRGLVRQTLTAPVHGTGDAEGTNP